MMEVYYVEFYQYRYLYWYRYIGIGMETFQTDTDSWILIYTDTGIYRYVTDSFWFFTDITLKSRYHTDILIPISPIYPYPPYRYRYQFLEFASYRYRYRFIPVFFILIRVSVYRVIPGIGQTIMDMITSLPSCRKEDFLKSNLSKLLSAKLNKWRF